MNVMPKSKPKLRKAGGIWFCSDHSISAQGADANGAYREYKRQRVVMDRWNEPDPHRYGNSHGYDRDFTY
jgi:hypothetical protein